MSAKKERKKLKRLKTLSFKPFSWCAISLSEAKQSGELFCREESLRDENSIIMRV